MTNKEYWLISDENDKTCEILDSCIAEDNIEAEETFKRRGELEGSNLIIAKSERWIN